MYSALNMTPSLGGSRRSLWLQDYLFTQTFKTNRSQVWFQAAQEHTVIFKKMCGVVTSLHQQRHTEEKRKKTSPHQSQPLCPPLSSPLCSSPAPLLLPSCRTKRWTWSRCTGVWTVFWTRTWPTSRSPAPLSRSLRWTSAAQRPHWRLLWGQGRTTTHPRALLWPPSSQGRGARLLLSPSLTMGGPWAGRCPRPRALAAARCRRSRTTHSAPLFSANTGRPTGGSSDRVLERPPCPSLTRQSPQDPDPKPLTPLTVRPYSYNKGGEKGGAGRVWTFGPVFDAEKKI